MGPAFCLTPRAGVGSGRPRASARADASIHARFESAHFAGAAGGLRRYHEDGALSGGASVRLSVELNRPGAPREDAVSLPRSVVGRILLRRRAFVFRRCGLVPLSFLRIQRQPADARRVDLKRCSVAGQRVGLFRRRHETLARPALRQSGLRQGLRRRKGFGRVLARRQNVQQAGEGVALVEGFVVALKVEACGRTRQRLALILAIRRHVVAYVARLDGTLELEFDRPPARRDPVQTRARRRPGSSGSSSPA